MSGSRHIVPTPWDDDLLNQKEAATKCRVSASRWSSYWPRFNALKRGRRIVDTEGTGYGVSYWLRSACVEHMHRELASDRVNQRARKPGRGVTHEQRP